MSELTDSNTGLAMISSYTPAGWLGGSHLHNNATLWPNLQVRTCKNSSQVEFQVGPSVAISLSCMILKNKTRILYVMGRFSEPLHFWLQRDKFEFLETPGKVQS